MFGIVRNMMNQFWPESEKREARLVRKGDFIQDPRHGWIRVENIVVDEDRLCFSGDDKRIILRGYDTVPVLLRISQHTSA